MNYDEYEYYIDGGYSGKNLNRPAIQKLMKDAKANKIDCVIVFKLDRLSRSQKDTLFLIEEIFNKHNVGFTSIQEKFDTTTPFGKAMIGILSVFAQLERETILERTRIGTRKRAEEGKWRGGGKIPFPYMYDSKQGILVPDKKKVEIYNKMISMYISGKSFGKIGEIVGMDESVVERRILSRTNLGLIKFKDEEFQGQHEPVITKELYDKVIETNKLRAKARTERHYLLSGKIYCGHCYAKYRYQKWGKRIICYCYSQQKSKSKYIKDPNCKNKRWDSFEIEDAVIENLFSMALDEKLFNDNFDLAQINVRKEYENRIVKINNQISNLVSFLSEGIALEETKKKLKVLEEEKANLQNTLCEIKDKEEKNINSYEMLKNLQSTWFKMEFEEKRIIIMNIIDKVVVTDDNIEIFYKIS